MSKTILTGIKPTGMPHLGNYIGAIRPALEKAKNHSDTSYLFIADYHSLTTVPKPTELKQMIYEVSAAWLASGLDPKQTIIYRQSDIPELFELHWILSCLTPKGLMNRAHSYKALLQFNHQAKRKNIDHGINMGIYNYPILMAADILLFSADEVPVSQDQAQHLEIARDIAMKFNHTFQINLLKPPTPVITGDPLPGLDGRKMSKSYNNHIPLFSSSAALETWIKKIKTDSSSPLDPKEPTASILFALYKAFASHKKTSELEKQYRQGIGWGQVKDLVYKELNSQLEEKRKSYQHWIANPKKIDQILQQGAIEARKKIKTFMQKIRRTIGIVND